MIRTARTRFIVLAAVLGIAWPAGGAETAAAVRLRVTAELANIRLAPSISSVIIRQIAQGEILEATRRDGEWYLVKLEPDEQGTASGYVHESLVLALDETSRAERKAQIAEIPAKKAEEPPAREQSAGEAVAETDKIPTLWSVSLFAGGNYTGAGGLNAGARGFADFFETRAGGPADQAVTAVHFSFLFGGEFSFALSPRFSVLAGADFYAGARQSLISYTLENNPATFTTKPSLQAIPLRVGLSYLPLHGLSLKLGVAFYIVHCGYFYRYEQGTFWQEMEGSANGTGLGVWGAIGYEWAFADNFSFVAEIAGQYAPVRNFKGTGTKLDSDAAAIVTEDGPLYAYDYTQGGMTIPSLLLIRNRKPAEAYVANAAVATIDFSGISIRAGVKARF
jgi:hypothetical protein